MRRLASSLRGRIFLASALVAVVSLAAALQLVTREVSRQTEAELRKGLERAARLVAEEHASRLESLALLARLVADLPTLKAAVATADPPTVTPLAEALRRRASADLIEVRDARGRLLARVGDDVRPGEKTGSPARREGSAFVAAPRAVLQVTTVPIQIGPEPAERLGTLSLGARLDLARVRRIEAVTEARVAFALGGRVLASSLPAAAQGALERLGSAREPVSLEVEGEDFLVVRRALAEGDAAPVAFVLVSRSERLAVLGSFRAAVAGTGIVALSLALVLSWAVARTVSGPLAELTAAMREMAATGNLARPIGPASAWSDEDAAVVARSFSGLTAAIARFQREAASRERLSALGRLSAVIAHEVRNPLMIIKSSVASLRRAGADAERIHEAAEDIDHEVSRLSRLVDGVLDYARPPRLQYAPVVLADLCREALQAGLAGEPAVSGALRVEAGLAGVVTDGERLRGVLVNVLQNAREAVLARSSRPDGGAGAEELRDGAPAGLATGSPRRQPPVRDGAPAGLATGSPRRQPPDGGAGAEELRDGAPAGLATGSPRRQPPDGNEPDVVVWLRAEREGRLAIEVEDRGAGLAPDDAARAFEPYFTTRASGTGLGLAIARNVVEALGGTISLSSREGHGTTLRIELPARPAEGR